MNNFINIPQQTRLGGFEAMKRLLVTMLIVTALLFCAVGSARAIDTPEMVYSKYLSALNSGNWNKMISYFTAARKAKFEKYDTASKRQMMDMMQIAAPRSYTVTKKDVNVEMKRATLWMKGKAYSPIAKKVGPAYGKVTFKKESGFWKIDKENWGRKPIE